MATYHTGVISGQEAEKLYSYPTLAAQGTTDTTLYLAGNGTWASAAGVYEHPTIDATIGTPTTSQAPEFGEDVTISSYAFDSLGHFASLNNWTLTLPDYTATSIDAGLMSAQDKISLASFADRLASLEGLLTEQLTMNIDSDTGITFTRSNNTTALTIDIAGYY